MKRQYTIYNICVLLALLFLGGGWNDAWGQGTYLVLDLGNNHEDVNVINITFNGTRPADMTVYYSNTGNNNSWQSVNYSGDVRNGSSFTLSQAVTARYIRLRFTRSNDDNRWNPTYYAVSISDLSLAYVDMSKITITPHNGTFPHVDVPTLVDTVYVRDGEERTLVTGNYEYYWYFRWYRRNMNEGAAEPTTIERITPTTEGANYLVEVTDDPSYFWAYNIRNLPTGGATGDQAVWNQQKEHKRVASIVYTGNGELDSVFCDVSFNIDNLGINPSGPIYQEPTIGKRYKFIIKPAEEMRERLANVNDNEAMETINITVPEGATNVNLSMDMEANSYFWGNNATSPIQGNAFEYSTDDGTSYQEVVPQSTDNMKLITLEGPINSTQTVWVRASSNSNSGTECPAIVKYILTPQTNSGFLTENNISNNDEKRNPEDYPNKYVQVGVVDFDFDSSDGTPGKIPAGNLSTTNNWRKEPLSSWRTSYSFADPELPWISHPNYMPEDAYGLYRTANVSYRSGWSVEGISRNEDYPSNNEQDYNYLKTEYYDKTYGWYHSKTLYDRTYVRTHGNSAIPDSCGYFYYVNASKEAGRVVNIPIEGTLCQNTQLTVIAWVADMTSTPGTDELRTPPNLSLVLLGENEKGESKTLHHFSSGDMSANGGTEQAVWKQLCYNIAITDEIASYSNFSVEIYNNTKNSGGADYAIDDIRIFCTLPNIEVYRENACDAATLIVSTDYETILDNMGWTEGQDVITADEYNVITESTTVEDLREILDKRKYRYGLMGDKPDNPQHLNSVVGNVYFAFLSFDDKNNNGKIDPDEESSVEWQSVNNAIVEENPELDLEKVAHAIRIAVPTDIPGRNEEPKFEFFTRDREKAIKNGQIMNYRAIQDYNHDIAYWQEIEGKDKHPDKIEGDNINPLDESGNDNPNFNEENYNKAIRKLYARLGIPRIRCPWYYTEGTGQNRIRKLYLGIIDVDNTDLHYQDEPIPGSENETYSGDYWVMTFSAAQIVNGGEASVTDFDDCTLMSPFTVQPATTITVETMTDATTALCEGAVRKITPTLNVYDPDTNEPVENFSSYIFDWFLGSEEEFKALTFGSNGYGLHQVIEAYRNRGNGTDRDEIDPDTFINWVSSNYGDDAGKTIQDLFDAGKLLTGTQGGKTLIIEIRSEDYIAMPYVWNEEDNDYVYCTDWTRVHFDVTKNDIPDFYVGLRLADSPVALRLGLRHLEEDEVLTIPVSKALKMAEGVDHFGLAEAKLPGDEEANPVYVVINGVYTLVGQLTALNVPKPADDGTVSNAILTIKWNSEASSLLHEGEQYILRIPFVQVDASGKVLASQCDGLAYFQVKIVPEYLTWKGGTSDNWYDESKWNQSTEGEVYFDNAGTSTKDANGTDADLTKAFSPLYFTKITIPGSSNELALFDVTQRMDESDNRFLASWATDNSDTIRYEMAIDTLKAGETGLMANHTIRPYYINKVDQIYFKPNASLYRQDYLTYNKAWVDFEMKANTPYWMSAPLQDVYAGDMYAPSSNGRQETEVFNKDITYSGEYEGGTTNSRWRPAFYQKAWDKAIAYVTKESYTHSAENATDVAAVKSNWSIEYNDVWVPYSEGKGFYARVEDLPEANTTRYALVRLPKADTEYSYETKAANNLSKGENISRANAYKLWGDTEEATKGNVTVDLSKVDGDNQHFLVGNPYMAYLDMDAFFKRNSVLAKKYWLLENGTSKAVVGTPDVDWKGNETEDATNGGTIDGLIPPMTAFFVELANTSTATQADNTGAETSISITFTPDMMAKRPQSTAETKAASFAATNPTLTITAECGETRSVAKLVTSDKAENGYRASEDAVVLLDSELDAPMVYTVAGSRAAQVNAMKEISNVGLGVYNENDDEATVTISGLSRMASPLYLYDARTRKSVELSGDSYTMQITGDSHGRYYLRNSAMADELENTISIYSAQRGQVIVSALQPVREIKVFNVSGALVRQFSVNTTQYTFPIQSGLYIIYASDGEQEQTEKVIVR